MLKLSYNHDIERTSYTGVIFSMKEVSICVGSSCHLKGAHDVVEIFKDKVKEYDLKDEIHLKASFCQGKCTDGVVVTVDNEFLTGVNPENAAEIFDQVFMEGDKNNESA